MKKITLFFLPILLFASMAQAATIGHSSTLGLPTNNLGLVGWWTFDGAQTNWATGNANDSSGSGNHQSLRSRGRTSGNVLFNPFILYTIYLILL